MRKPTIHDVAELAKVSAGTVSNVLNRPSYVSSELRDRVRVAMSKLNYEPRESARQFRPGRVRNLGLVLADMGNPFFVGIALGAQEVAREEGVGLVICHSAEDSSREIENLDLLLQQRVQGIIIAAVDETNEKLDALIDREVPIVFVDRVPQGSNLSSVSIDEHLGGELIGQYFGSRGVARVGFVGDLDLNPKIKSRMMGVEAGAKGYDCQVQLISVSGWTVESGEAGARAWLQQPGTDRPLALACANDMVALGLIKELWRNGVRVPDDVEVMGYDDLDMATSNTIPLSTVRQPRTLVGRTAAELILSEIEPSNQDHKHRRVNLTPELVLRETTRK